MSYQEEEQVRLKRRGTQQAIALAMQGRWREAIVANNNLIENFPTDVEAHNRLGRAHMELGEYDLARAAYRRTIELDPYNAIAKKNLNRLSRLGQSKGNAEGLSHKVEPQHFIEETGKAGVVNLHRLAPGETLIKMVAGDEVILKIDGSNLAVENSLGEYLGQVGPKHGQRLIRLMQGGNKYTATVIRSTEETMTVIIREAYQDPGQEGQLSFPPKRVEKVRPYFGERLLRRELEEGEEEEMEESGYSIVGGDEGELLSEESTDVDRKADRED
ncbi:MAG: tetratricopeptide repeat protein [Dehalococcoidales bacterium]|nr:tetratricopeptide repeat protein [Dehalococcoidales bacterium]